MSIETQSKEFNAAAELSRAYRSLPAVVDDDYEEGRFNYERAVKSLLEACRANGRMEAEKSSPSLDFGTLRAGNVARLPEFKNAQGSAAHAMADGSDWSDSDWLEAVVGELGEYCNIRKKLRRGDFERGEATPKMADELADTIIYLDILAFRLGINLGSAIQSKWNRTSERVGSKLRIYAGGVERKT